MALTLVPEPVAERGHVFTFLGPNDEECAGCPVQGLCFRLEVGRRYVVTATRDVVHPCRLHEGGRVRVVEVAEEPVATSLETKHLRGTAATWNPVPCGMPECPRYRLCHPVGPASGVRYAIAADEGAIDCPAGFDLHAVRLRPT